MGMSASQSRLLALTSRMSDLEYKAQSISNCKIRLSVQTEGVAKAYSDALNKERLSVLTGFNNSTSTYADLTYSTLCQPGNGIMSQYGLSTSTGKILVSKDIEDKFKKSANLNDFLSKMGQVETTYGSGTKTDYDNANLSLNGGKDASGNTVAGAKSTYETAKANTASALGALDAYGKKYVEGYSTAGAWSRTETTTSTSTTPGTTTPSTRGTGTSTTTTTPATRGTGTSTTTGARRIIAADADPYDEATRRATDPTTTRTGGTTTGSRGTTTTTTNTNTYNNVSNPDKIKFINGTTDSKDADGKDIATEYSRLKGVYDAAVTTELGSDRTGTTSGAKFNFDQATMNLAALAPTVVNQGSNVAYYTNLYNRMCDGYATVGDADEDNTLNNAEWLQSQIYNNNLTLEKANTDGEWEKVSWKSDPNITQESDDRDMAKAEAQYTLATAEIQSKDKKFDLELKNIETEHTAIQTEVDSVKKVIEKNIDRSFKTFNA